MTTPSAEELAAVPLFRSLSAADLAEVAERFSVRLYPGEALIASEGDRLSMFNVILTGQIQWYWTDEDARQLKLQPEGPGGHFADTTLGGEPILMSIVALEPVRVAEIPMEDFQALLLRYPGVGRALLLDVVARLRRTLKATRTLSMDEVYTRVVKLLMERTREDGAAHLTQVEIGQQVGATREMVGRILRDLARGGYIDMARGRIVVLRKLPRRW
jgi:CRP/FNR family transcriptional regulator, cyclic AMP receptor protein